MEQAKCGNSVTPCSSKVRTVVARMQPLADARVVSTSIGGRFGFAECPVP